MKTKDMKQPQKQPESDAMRIFREELLKLLQS